MEISKDELLEDIDSTVDRLVENAEAIKSAKSHQFFSHEVEVLERAQESLLARLMHREAFEGKERILKSIRQESVHQKIAEFARKSARRQKRASSRKARSKSRG